MTAASGFRHNAFILDSWNHFTGPFITAKRGWTWKILSCVPASCNRQVFLEWFNVQPQPSWAGVPTEGRIGGFDIAEDFHDASDNGVDASSGTDAGRRNRSRQQKLHDMKMSKIQDNHFELIELCKYNRTPTDEYLSAQAQILNQWRTRKRAAKPGHPSLDRIRGVADRQKGEKRYKKRKVGDTAANPVLQLRERICRKGLKSGTYVEVVSSDRRERWFMRIVDGGVLDKNGDDPALTKALWCEANSVHHLSKTHTTAVRCDIRSIIDAGPREKFNASL